MAFDLVARGGLDPNAELDRRVHEPAHLFLDGRVGVSTTDDSWSLLLSGTNLTNVDSSQIVTSIPFFARGLVTQQLFQRNWSLALRHAF